MTPVCPGCGTDYDGKEPHAEWLTCGHCGRIWEWSRHQASRRSATHSGNPPAIAVDSRKMRRTPSGEYLPETGKVGVAEQVEALTARVDGEPDLRVREAIQRRVEEHERERGSERTAADGSSTSLEAAAGAMARAETGTAAAESASDRHGTGTSDPAGDQREPTPADDVVDAGSVRLDLFEQIEKQIDRQRSVDPTQEVAGFGDPSGRTDALPDVPATSVPLGPPPVPVDATAVEEDDLGRQLTEESVIDLGSDPLIGAEVGGCLIDRKLGEGGMGSVYHGTQLRLDRGVAIKVLPPEMKRNTKFLKRFEHEAKSLARINHPNILHIYDFGEDSHHELYYMIMEFVDGEDMAEILARERRFDQIRMLDILLQALSGLECAAQAGVVHRDIKPDNLMITSDGTCKVSDFGLAKDAAAMTQVTNMGVRVGTPAFMSPEQCDGETLDWRSDVYSLGITAYVGLTGCLPFTGESPFAIMLKHKTEPPPTVEERVPTIDPRVDDLVQQLMAKAPGDRGESLTELREYTRDLLNDLRGHGSSGKRASSSASFRVESSSDEVLPPLPSSAMITEPGPMSGAQRPDLPPLDLHSARPTTDRQSVSPPIPAAAQSGPVESQSPLAEVPAATPVPPNRPVADATHPSSGLTLGPGPAPPPPNQTPRPPSAERPQRGLRSTPAPANRASGIRPGPTGEKGRSSGRRDSAARARQSEVFQLEEEGDRLLAEGRERAAIASWQQAAQLGAQWQIREAIFRKIERTQSTIRARRRRRLVLLLGILFIVTIASGWLVTPYLHRHLADRALQEADQVGAPDSDAREQAYRGVVDAFADPPIWCQIYGHRQVEVPAVERARLLAQRIAADRQSREQDAQRDALLGDLREAAGSESGSWRQIKVICDALLGPNLVAGLTPADRAYVQQQRQQAVAGIDAFAAGRATVMGHLRAGRVGAALDLAERLGSDPRLSSAQRAELPDPWSLSVVTPEDKPPQGLQITVASQPVEDFDGRLYRLAGQAIPFTVSAPGYIRFLGTIAGDQQQAEGQHRVVLSRAIAWSRSADRGVGRPAWLGLEAIDRGTVLLHGDRRVVSIELGSGRDQWSLTPESLSSSGDPVTWTGVRSIDARGLVLATTDGDVFRIPLRSGGAEPQPRRIQTLRDAVVARVDYQMDLVADQEGQATIQHQEGVYRVSVQIGEQRTDSEVITDQGGLVPQLFTHRDRLFVLAQRRIHVMELDGRLVGARDLERSRSGPAALLGGSGLLAAVPAGRTLVALDFNRAGEAVAVDTRPWSAADGGRILAVASAGQQAVVQTDQGEVAMLLWETKSGWQQQWSARIRAGSAGGCWVDDRVVVAFDDAGAVSVFDRATGALRFGYDHHAGIIAAGLFYDHLVIYDDAMVTTAFSLDSAAD